MKTLAHHRLFTIYAFMMGTFALDCDNTLTSEGWVTLGDGMYACAALRTDQGLADLGRNYVLCVHGNAIMMPCPPHLRWDTSVNTCNYPNNVRCELPNLNRVFTWSAPYTPTQTATENGQLEDFGVAQKAIGSSVTDIDGQYNDCVRVATSEGPRTLKHGERACAPLLPEETSADVGRKFITCSFGTVHIQFCQSGLRYDTATNTCNWPQLATCALKPEVPSEDNTAATPKTSIPVKPPTQSSSSRSPLLTTPTTLPPAPRPVGPCNNNSCQLPNCFCLGDRPRGVPVADTPMFVMLTFDDALTTSLYNYYYRPLLVDNNYMLHNPNGCPVKSTFYVSHENTDYTKVTALFEAGHEIGSHTIHHRLPQGDSNRDYPEMVAEIQGMKDEALRATGNKKLVDSITGFRAPYLRVAGDVQFDVLRDYGFQYDTSILNINILQRKVPDWPYTLDFVMRECINPPCPTKSYPGMWEVPLNGWLGEDNAGCAMIDDCNVGTSRWTATEQQWYNLFNRNFQQYFYPIKVPMPIFTHGFLFTNYPNSYHGLARWLQDTLRTRDNVWLVTPQHVIEWMKNPLTNSEMIAQKWGC